MMEQPKKKIKRECNHRWSDIETTCLLAAIAEKVKTSQEGFEKPTAQKFYSTICQKEESLKNIAALRCSVIKNKMRYLRKTFINAEEWKGKTGAGLLEEGGESSVKEYIEKICPHYNALEQIFGQRKSIVLPYTYDSYADMSFDTNDDILFDYEPASQDSFATHNEGNTDSIEFVCEETVQQQATENVKKKLKLTPTEKKSNSALDFLAKSQEKRNEVEQLKLALQEKLEEQRLNLQENIEQNKLDLQREQLEFEKEKYRNEFELQKLKMQQEMELKKFELELKYKIN